MLKAIASIASGEASPAVWLSRLRPLLDLRYLVLLSSIAVYALIVLGGTVRATGSGLACPDWPRCHGQWIPPLESQVLIEYSHRLAAVSVGFLILGTAATAWLRHRQDRPLLMGVSLAILLLIAQVLVGGVTVNTELPDTIVAVHLALALVLLAVLIVVTAVAFKATTLTRPRVLGWSAFPVLATLTTLATFALILLGSYVANSGAGLAYPDWPLFDGQLAPAGGRLANLHYAHRVLAAAAGLLVLAMMVQALRLRSGQAWRRRGGRRPIPLAAASLALILYVAQVLVGAANIWLELATSVRVAHLALASALWATLVVAAVTWGYLGRQEA